MKLIFGIGVFIFISLLLFNFSSAFPSFRGITPQDENLYKSEIITCKDGSKKFSRAQLNDDFCDCPDGTDEPGTSACPNGRFYCRNAGHSPKVIFSSRVDDGICDCCDGSDESSLHCPNTCWQQGQAARDKLRSKISTFKDGLVLRNQLIQQAKSSLAKDQADLSDLKSQEKTLSALVNQLKDQKEQIEKAEEKERLRKEQEDKAKKDEKEQEDKAKIDETVVDNKSDKDETGNTLDTPTHHPNPNDHDIQHEQSETSESPDDHDNQHKPSETSEYPNEIVDVTKSNDASENSEELTREELGRLVASRWTGENTEKQADDVDTAKDNNHDESEDLDEDTTKDSNEHESYASETDDDHRYDDDIVDDEISEDFKEEDPLDSSSSYKYDSDNESEYSDTGSTSNPSLLEKIQLKLRSILKGVSLFQTPVNQSDATRIRNEYDESSGKLSKIQSRISSLTQKLKHDFGPDKEFYSFYDKCFEGKENKYVYKVCPFKHASQEEGHSSTRLGRWEKFDQSYKVMIFSNGDKCWNGPDRSLTVKLRCGLKNEVADVDEPSRCEYVALLSTPAVCFEEKLKELQHKLDEMNKDQPENHDEL